MGTTQIYTHVVNEQLKTATDNNPLNAPVNRKEIDRKIKEQAKKSED